MRDATPDTMRTTNMLHRLPHLRSLLSNFIYRYIPSLRPNMVRILHRISRSHLHVRSPKFANLSANEKERTTENAVIFNRYLRISRTQVVWKWNTKLSGSSSSSTTMLGPRALIAAETSNFLVTFWCSISRIGASHIDADTICRAPKGPENKAMRHILVIDGLTLDFEWWILFGVCDAHAETVIFLSFSALTVESEIWNCRFRQPRGGQLDGIACVRRTTCDCI